ncbi:MAG: S41 family peptidase [Patescibacteria group bacterium]
MTIKLKTLRIFAVVLSLMVLSWGVGYRLGHEDVSFKIANSKPQITITSKEPPKEKNINFDLFWKVWERVAQQYVDKEKLDPQKMVYGAISGMVAAIGDPYTIFLPPKENRESKESLNGSFEGIGAQLGIKEKRIIVVAPISGMPAEKAGIKTGDWILKVDGKETANWTLPETVAKIRGPKGTEVVLTIIHEGQTKAVDLKIVRDTITIKSIEWKKMENDVIYLRLSRFGEDTNAEWDEAVGKIREVGNIRGIVFDLRNNPGGYLKGAVYIASEFIKSGLIVKQVNGDGSSQSYNVERAGKLTEIPVVVLINGGSASASEIVAGAIQARGRGQLVGDKSFGKGSVQEAEDLPGGSGLHVTISKWLLPNPAGSGGAEKWINGEGLTPDVKIENDESQPDKDLQLEKAIEVLK